LRQKISKKLQQFFKSVDNEWTLPVNDLESPENRQKFTGFIKLNRLRPMLFLLYA
jgi:hypothetical protein